MSNIRKEMHHIRYTFDKAEIAQKSTQLAETCGEKARLIEEKKSVNSQYKAKIDEKDSVISLLSMHITNGYELKKTECEVEYDFDRNVKRIYYQGVLQDTHPMTDDDRQLTFE